MKDFLGYEVGPGDYFCYPLSSGSTPYMALYRFVSENESGKVKACKVEESGGSGFWKYKIYDRTISKYRDMTEAERAKVDGKTSTLSLFTERAVKIDYKGRAE